MADSGASWAVVYIGVAVQLLGGLLLNATGIAVGAASRYGLPPPLRPAGGWLLAVAGMASMAVLVVIAAMSAEKPSIAGWFAFMFAGWVPGFVAAALGANRWVLLAMIPAGIAMAAVVGLWQFPPAGVALLG